MGTPRVSIITPIKADDEEDVRWLGEAIKSVQNQSEQDWEMIIINDHSKASMSSLGSLFKEDPRLKGAKAPNQAIGVSHARNQAARMARSELLLPLDADDLLRLENGGGEGEDHALAEYLKAWDAEGHKRGIVYCNVKFFTKDAQAHYESPEYGFDLLLQRLLMPVGSLHRRADWERAGGWKPEMEYGLEDWEYWITLGEQGVCGYHLNLPLYHYRRHPKGRLAFLRDNGDAYNIAYGRLRDLHIDTYSGRRPAMCCGSALGKPVGVPRARARQQQQRRPQTEQRTRATLAVLNTDKLVTIHYVGPAYDFYVRGRNSGLRYHVSGPGKPLELMDGRKGVDPSDVDFILSMDNRTTFTLP